MPLLFSELGYARTMRQENFERCFLFSCGPKMIGWLVDWLVGWMVGETLRVGWLVGWLVDWLPVLLNSLYPFLAQMTVYEFV